jgi:hypothetical protein
VADDVMKLHEKVGAEMKEVAKALSDLDVRITVAERLDQADDDAGPRKGRRR